jgi:hypothetical protein
MVNMDAKRFSETSVLTTPTWRNIPEDGVLQNLKNSSNDGV